MTGNPYSVLGIAPSASNDEVKKAYRELSRKYHPDTYIDNPLSDLAEEKFKEVQEAYEQIMKDRENGYGSSGASYSQGSGADSAQLSAVANYLNNSRYQEALQVLSGISNRTARWYYYSALANAGIGNNVVAKEHAAQAVNMEPNNRDYNNLLNQFQWQTQRYQSNYGNMSNRYGTGNFCCDLWCADSLCECMGGDLCSCM